MRESIGNKMTLERLHERIRAALFERRIQLILGSKHEFRHSVMTGHMPFKVRVVVSLLNCGLHYRELIKRIPVVRAFAQRIYWDLRSRYIESVDQER